MPAKESDSASHVSYFSTLRRCRGRPAAPCGRKVAGENGAAVSACLNSLGNASFTPGQIARLLRSIIAGRQRDRVLVPDLVVSGPDVPGVPTADTYAVVQSLFQEAQNEIVLAGYAFHNGKLLFERLTAKVVVIDRAKLFLTSANFTGAAHHRNIEMGLLSHAPYLAEQVAAYFEGLRQSGRLMRLP